MKKIIHLKEIEVKWGDMDAYGHVNNTNYFLYVQEARFDMMEKRKICYDPNISAPVLAETTCKFIKPINYPEEIIVETWFSDVIDNKKLVFEHIIKSKTNKQLYAILTATNVWYDFLKKKAISIPEDVIKFLSN